MLIEQQMSALAFIARRHRENHGITPTYREIVAELRLSSTSQVHRIIATLVAQGCIRRLPNKHQAIEVLPLGFYYLREAA